MAAGSGLGHNPGDRRYTTEHEWIKPDGDQYVIGITAFAQDQLGDITGEVVEVNGELVDQPQSVNDDPYERGWMIKIRGADTGEVEKLLTAEQYSEQTGD